MRGKTVLRIFYLVCALAVAAIIFIFSSQEGEASGKTSEAASSAIIEAVRSFLPELSDAEAKELACSFNAALRKLAHAFIFALLGFFCASFALTFKGSVALHGISGWLAALAYAALDELHQLLVPGRGPSVLDVALDGSGAALGASAAALICVIAAARSGARE